MDATSLQRARDGAFFEDWSEWRDLGGHPQYVDYGGRTGKRPTNMPAYYCTLRQYSDLIGGPAFEIAIPQQDPLRRMVSPIAGARRYTSVRQGPVEIWLVPADQWPALRKALPAIKNYIGALIKGNRS